MTAMPTNFQPAIDGKEVTPSIATSTAIHQRFSWLHEHDKGSVTLSRMADAMDALRGIQTCLELVEMSNLQREMNYDAPENGPPTLSPADTGNLMRLAILVSKEWSYKFEEQIESEGSGK